jgi:hypothetical protein
MSLDIFQICGTIRELEARKPARPGGLRKIFDKKEALGNQQLAISRAKSSNPGVALSTPGVAQSTPGVDRG